jgi:hypothetical protein
MNDKVRVLTDTLILWPIWVRDDTTFFERMFKCPLCTGFHCGWVVWLLETARQGEVLQPWVPVVCLWTLACGAFCYVVDVAMQRLEQSPLDL